LSRARAFDIDTAIDRALLEFWRKGYEGTSIADLTDALGINRPSLYAAFGNKEGLFRKALERYLSGPGAGLQAALAAPSARAAAESILYFHADAAGDARRPEGCLLVQGALACSDENQPIRQALIEARRAGELALTERFERAQAEGDLGPHDDPAELSRYVWTVCHGLAVQAAAGATHAEQRRVVARALRAFPEPS
jgi:AcrR family transcriptional regulator